MINLLHINQISHKNYFLMTNQLIYLTFEKNMTPKASSVCKLFEHFWPTFYKMSFFCFIHQLDYFINGLIKKIYPFGNLVNLTDISPLSLIQRCQFLCIKHQFNSFTTQFIKKCPFGNSINPTDISQLSLVQRLG